MKKLTPLVAAFLCGCALFAPHKEKVALPPPTKPDEGLVYLYRDFDVEARETALAVKENGVVIGTLAEGTYFFRYAKPGRQYYAALPTGSKDGKGEGGAFVEVVAGETHYVQFVPQAASDGVRALVFTKYPGQATPAIRRLIYASPDPRKAMQIESQAHPPSGASP